MIQYKDISGLEFVKCVQGDDHHVQDLLQTRAFFKENARELNERIENGYGLVFRGFPIANAKEFAEIMRLMNPNFIQYSGAKVRQSSEEETFLYRPTSTPRFRKNFLHNEVAYQRDIPPKIVFFCQIKSPVGGESLVGDQRKVYQSLKPKYREKLEQKKIKFVRCLVNNSRLHQFLTKRFDLFATFPSWQGNFGTSDRSLLTSLCEEQGFQVDWTKSHDLVLSCVIDPVKLHPMTGEKMWVNNAHLFQLHKSVYGTALYRVFKTALSLTSRPPTHSYYGDGTPIEPEVIQNILDATDANEVRVDLNAGDFIYANNICISHGRTPFEGPRELYFGLLK